MENDINSVILEAFGEKLRAARERKGLSQRALAQRTGVPQAHISKIEQGRVDIRLSSLAELARALDLDVQLLPRQALPAVQGAVRAVESETGNAAESRALAALTEQERTLEQISTLHPDLASVRKLLPTIKDLKLLPLDPETVRAVQRAISPEQLAKLRQAAAGVDTAQLTKQIEQVYRSLRTLRNAKVHAPSLAAPRSTVPAYRLTNDDDDD